MFYAPLPSYLLAISTPPLWSVSTWRTLQLRKQTNINTNIKIGYTWIEKLWICNIFRRLNRFDGCSHMSWTSASSHSSGANERERDSNKSEKFCLFVWLVFNGTSVRRAWAIGSEWQYRSIQKQQTLTECNIHMHYKSWIPNHPVHQSTYKLQCTSSPLANQFPTTRVSEDFSVLPIQQFLVTFLEWTPI